VVLFDNSGSPLVQFLVLLLTCGSDGHLPSERVRFGAFEIELSTGELRPTETPDPNHKVLLREQVFQVLRMLLEREGKIVSREEIKSRLWANDTVVDFDQSINATIKPCAVPLTTKAENYKERQQSIEWKIPKEVGKRTR
jgi:DNA-binding response OmpR family regulator